MTNATPFRTSSSPLPRTSPRPPSRTSPILLFLGCRWLPRHRGLMVSFLLGLCLFPWERESLPFFRHANLLHLHFYPVGLWSFEFSVCHSSRRCRSSGACGLLPVRTIRLGQIRRSQPTSAWKGGMVAKSMTRHPWPWLLAAETFPSQSSCFVLTPPPRMSSGR